MSGSCTQMRRKLVTHSSLNMATGETTPGKSEWVTEPCGAPIFGAKGETRCRSCLSGWTHPNNYPVPEPATVIEQIDAAETSWAEMREGSPFETWAFIDLDGERVCIIEYDNADCSYPFAQELIIRLPACFGGAL